MKWSILTLVVAFCASCTNQTFVDSTATTDTNLEETMQESTQESNQTPASILEHTDEEKLNQALALAIENKDYRLQTTSTRSINIPGVHPKDYQAMIALCGKKYNSNTGDVIRSEEERLARKKELNFMRQYNERMITICQEKSSQ
ncbi:hypothetical protein Q4506_04035 [Colwellia sp. 4_MG-2023]|jgi:hypothetical protein|uniref:hypothetical protein n=1 Tax=unclassified Colwellia TaxID=196834 RepID=UPI001C087B55|nr:MULTISPECIES: hypothetical protein [unclassified Colwellia]MBU2924073.1 hypothetical protein [Colwellia sp. C2M11]MDO6506106.1 hypothetical protein [Colwellia sp. 5_MG-2023]MDO6554834.1 hypothetical protein [Colwellia sp. 4_MG-2023]MDO6651963.1 hypothetical protein [Colwellia sp. 3_MG-2023]MDO6664739.1 hypothetical protein [Colwellia sp. 2_MG-2023]